MNLLLIITLFFFQAEKKLTYDRQEYASKLTKEFFRGDFWDMLTYPNSGKTYFQTKGEARKTATIIPIPVVEETEHNTNFSLKKDRMAGFILKNGQLIGTVGFNRANTSWYGGYDDDLIMNKKLYEAYKQNKDSFYLKCSTVCGYIFIRNNREYSWNNDTKSFE